MMDSGLFVLIIYLISAVYCLVITFVDSVSNLKRTSYGSFLVMSTFALLPMINTFIMLSGVLVWIAESKLIRRTVFWRKEDDT